jgi:TrmH family RNA methyltransferase
MELKEIASKDNQLLKRARKAVRGVDDILIEGPSVIGEAFAAKWPIDYVLILESEQKLYEDYISHCADAGIEVISLNEKLFAGVCDTVTSQGILAVAKAKFVEKVADFPELDSKPLLVCDRIQDPGNLGTIIRSAHAFECAGIALLAGTVNPFNSKVIRASAGAVFQIPLLKLSTDELFSQYDGKFAALETSGEARITDPALPTKLAVIVGNEGQGVAEDILEKADSQISIQMNPASDSLNAAVTTSIALYELFRSRK